MAVPFCARSSRLVVADDIIRYYVRRMRAMFAGTSQVRGKPSQTLLKCIRGGTGELVQANHYTKAQIGSNDAAAEHLGAYLLAYMGKSAYLCQEARQVARKHMVALLDLGAKEGLRGVYVQDWLLDTSIQGRQYVFDKALTGKHSFSTVYAYVQAGFAMPPEDKVRDMFQRALTSILMPAWKRVSYYHDVAKPEQNRQLSYEFFWQNSTMRDMVLAILDEADHLDDIYNREAIRQCALRNEPGNIHNISNQVVCHTAGMAACQHIDHNIFLAELNAMALEGR